MSITVCLNQTICSKLNGLKSRSLMVCTVTICLLRCYLFSADKKPVMSVSYDSQYDEFTAVCEIPLSGSVRADFSCNLYTGHLLFLKTDSRRRRSGKWSCFFTASKTDLLNRLQSVKSREVSCDYSLNSDPSVRSPMSHTYDISSKYTSSYVHYLYPCSDYFILH